jgi:hypothetical protein
MILLIMTSTTTIYRHVSSARNRNGCAAPIARTRARRISSDDKGDQMPPAAIQHRFAQSSFSKQIRVIFGLRGIAW